MISRAAFGQIAEQHVGRLDVAVHQPAGMRRVQRGRHLLDNAGGAARRQRALSVEQAAHILPADETHRDKQDPLSLAGLEDRDDVRMVNRCGGPRFPDEPLPEDLVQGEIRGQDLQGHPAVKPDVTGAVDDSHSAAADLLDYPVASYLRARNEITERRTKLLAHHASSVRPAPASNPAGTHQENYVRATQAGSLIGCGNGHADRAVVRAAEFEPVTAASMRATDGGGHRCTPSRPDRQPAARTGAGRLRPAAGRIRAPAPSAARSSCRRRGPGSQAMP